ncbi:chromate efflux transporter [Litoreibacter roseus]|uniref:Chromate transporter n=1 Tax=Litoreibacter roseus TaxID=2601869 RepID=A0A6N6JK23_9RHOB|nr:chromate efflux transporter [Litoreibacter roseus]GFE66671.1 chromate transporter [Litoreibacter roseus]
MSVSQSELFRVFGRVGVLSFGGPAAQIALMHKELVEDRPWLTEDQFLRALSFCMLLPGPEAMQLATYAGWRLNGVSGGLIAGLLFVLPGAAVILALALTYAYIGDLPIVQVLFLGVKATVVIVVLQALAKVAGKALLTPLHWVIAALSFMAIYLFDTPFPLVILAAALIGGLFLAPAPSKEVPSEPVKTVSTLRTIAIWGALWLMPLLAILIVAPGFLSDLALFFSTLAVVTFGGAYAVLTYMTQAVVGEFGWITTAQMMDALGLAETTPGPLILVTQFVGMLAGFREGGLGLSLIAGVVTLWMTFAPCFLWIFAGAPYIDGLANKPRLSGALSAITAAVVGVIANLSLWFASALWFSAEAVFSWQIGEILDLAITLPDLTTLQWQPVLITALAAALLIWRKLDLLIVLPLMALAAVGLSLMV